MSRTDILLVSIASTTGLRAADSALVGSLRRGGATVAIARITSARTLRTLALTDLAWAAPARAVARRALARARPRAVIYNTGTAALLGPVPGAIRFDAPAAANRPGRHGIWQRPLERCRFRDAPLLLPPSSGALAAAPTPHGPAVIVPIPVARSGPIGGARDIAAITYAANPEKKGLDRILAAWRSARRGEETLLVAGLAGRDEPGVRYLGALASTEYRALLRRARVYVSAPRFEDYGIAQLEALADGCRLVSGDAPGPYVALPLARELDPALVGSDLAGAVRRALDVADPDYPERAAALLQPFSLPAIDRLVADRVAPVLLGWWSVS